MIQRSSRVGQLAVVAWLAIAAAAVASGPAGRAAAQGAEKPPAVTAPRPAPSGLGGVPVVVFNRPVAVFRAPVLGLSPDERAEATLIRLKQILARGGPGAVSTQAIPQGMAVQVDGALAILLVPGDADALHGETVQALADRAAGALRQVLEDTRESRDVRAILLAVGLSALATAAAALVLYGVARGSAALRRPLLRFAQAHAQRVRILGTGVLRPDRMFRVLLGALRAVSWALAAVVASIWLTFVLRRFPYTRPWGERADGFLLGVVRDLAWSIVGALPDLLVALLIFLIARLILGVARGVFDRIEEGTAEVGWLDADTARPTRRIATVVVWLFALVMAYPYLPGSGTDAFRGISVLVGLMISIGASSSVAQGASGLILMYTRSFRPGEYVKLGEHEGTVVELGMFVTRIRTGLGEELVIPNSLVLGAVTVNYSRAADGPGFVLDTAVTIGYDAPWRQVHALLLEAARRTAGVVPAPAPRVFQTALSDFYVEYRLVCQAIPSGPVPRAELLSRLHGNVQDVFNEHGVQIMSPHYRGDPAAPKVVPEARWYEPPASRTDGASARPTAAP